MARGLEFTVDPHEFDGKRVLVTGGSKGIGQAVVARLGEGGATVLTTARTRPCRRRLFSACGWFRGARRWRVASRIRPESAPRCQIGPGTLADDARPGLWRDHFISPLPEATIAYAEAKAALANYSKGLSKEVSPKGIRVVRVSPGWVETEAAVRLVAELAEKSAPAYDPPRHGFMKSLARIPIGPPPKPKQLADLI